MAGTGKTTIAYSVCTELQRGGRLDASFFCSRASSECSDVSRILPTIAYQLAEQYSPFRSSLCRILGKKLSTSQRNISEQFELLIQMPLVEVADILPNGHVIVIDALHECSNPGTVDMMLEALFNHAASLPIRFFLTSRPEPAIANTFLARDNRDRSILHLHNVEEQLVKADIETYLTTKLAKLSLRRDQIMQLADQAGVLSIYAATLARYVSGTKTGANASARPITAPTGSKNRKNKKDREIDLLYKAILDGVLREEEGEEELEEEEVELIKLVIWTVVCVREPVTIRTLAALLLVDSEQVSMALQPLRSVLNVIEGSEVVSTLHASFPEFILNSERSGASLSCNGTTHNGYLARRCFELMTEELKFNICALETSSRFDKDVPDFDDRVKASISSGLYYACRYWAEHLLCSSSSEGFLACLGVFLHGQLLFWMEVLNLEGCIDKGPEILTNAQDWLTKFDGTFDTQCFLRDACNFVTAFATTPARESTPHIYISAFPLVPRQSKVWKSYWGRTRGLLWVEGAALARVQVGYEVRALAYSPDGTRIILGTNDGRVEVRDAHSGTALDSSFEADVDGVKFIVFSPDSTRLAFGSGDGRIRVWDVHSGTPLGSLFQGRTQGVTSVAYSPDDARIVFGSQDGTIRVWDMHSGNPLGNPFEGHTGGVTSVSFSPDGACIVSGSQDCTIRVWDVRSGTPLQSGLWTPSPKHQYFGSQESYATFFLDHQAS